ncbi:MAG: hypothetical protein DLM69_02235 [Candidatus Chloroheliales bacterium]|nr:MAG: hypothetical protein DLM69_02235 [Chloroflexota bacterium]
MANSKSNIRALVSAGLAAGATLGALASTVARQRAGASTSVNPALINWRRAQGIAAALNRNDPFADTPRAQFNQYYAAMIKRAAPLVAAAIGSEMPNRVLHVAVVSRAEWVAANIGSFRQLFAPIERFHAEGLAEEGNSGAIGNLLFGGINQALLSAEVGTLLGYLARHVLGQYDLSLLAPEMRSGKLYFVEPNITALQTQLGLDPDDFRLWITLHEVTHAYQFEAHAWLRPYFDQLLNEYFDTLREDLGALREGALGLRTFIERARSRDKSQGWIEVVMTPQQRDIFQRIQALMTIVEGSGNYVMNSVGKELLPSYDYIHERVEHRQGNRKLIEKLFMRITGLDIKMEQYALGEVFLKHVAEAKGQPFANLVWRGPDYLPTIEEIKNPDAWIARVAAMQAG